MLGDRILAALREKPGLKAKDLARLLGVDKSEINSLLHYTLKGQVVQDNAYKWRLRTDAQAKPHAHPPVTKNSHSDLFRYYLECLAVDNTAGVRVFADGKYDLDYVELESLPLDDDVVNPHLANDMPTL